MHPPAPARQSGPQSEYRCQTRRGKGVKAGIFNKKTGRLVGLKQITQEEDVMLISNNGIVLRTPASLISVIGRDTLGVKIMKLREEDRVVCIAVADKIAEDQTDESDLEAMEINETISVEE